MNMQIDYETERELGIDYETLAVKSSSLFSSLLLVCEMRSLRSLHLLME